MPLDRTRVRGVSHHAGRVVRTTKANLPNENENRSEEAVPTPSCEGMDPDIWFPNTGHRGGDQWRTARSICQHCPMRLPCLRMALTIENGTGAEHRYGMFGGHTPTERAAMKRAA